MTLDPRTLALYLGCECLYKDADGNERRSDLIAVNISGYAFFADDEEDDAMYIKDVKPILRKLDSMSEEEQEELFGHKSDWLLSNKSKWKFWTDGKGPHLTIKDAAIITNWLRNRSFDCDGLIEKGLAIDISTLKQ